MWYGNINYMGYATEEDYVVRFSDEHLTAEMLDVLYGVSSFFRGSLHNN